MIKASLKVLYQSSRRTDTHTRERQAYSATYDYLSRMSVASYYDITDGGTVSSDQKYKEEVTYADARGNIKTLKRNGMYPSGSAWAVGQIDNLTYGYTSGTNKLATLTEAASTSAAKPLGFNPGAGGTGYTYDKNGNLIKDTYKGITAITYNYLNLPVKISFGSSKSITFTYDATGRKLKKVTAGGSSAENYTQYYADGLEYKSTTLEAIYHEEGRLTPKTSTTWQYEYYIRDHLGNTRLTFADKNGDNTISVTNLASTNEVLQENHYTPFGLELGYAWMNDAALADSKYRFGGKELNADFGLKLNDFGARWYDPAVGRWASVDALANHPNQVDKSPYAYAWNNPIRYDDPDGNCPTCPTAAAGAVVGGVIGVGASLINQWNNESIDWGQVLIDGGKGAATGGAIGFAGPLALQAVGTTALTSSGLMTTMAVGGVASGTAETGAELVEQATGRRESLDGGQIAKSTMVGGMAAGAGGVAGTLVKNSMTAASTTSATTTTTTTTTATASTQSAATTGATVGATMTNAVKGVFNSVSNWLYGKEESDEKQ